MDPKCFSPYALPDFGGVFLPFRFWTTPASMLTDSGLWVWSISPHVVGVT